MSTDPVPAPLSNNMIPRGAVWGFGILFLAGLLALPFAVFKMMALTQNQAQGMTLAAAAGLPIDSRNLHATVRETENKAIYASRYELLPVDAAKVAEALAPVDRPDAARLAELLALAPEEKLWQPAAGSRGPWHAGSGFKDGLDWWALFDEGTGTLWVYGRRAK